MEEQISSQPIIPPTQSTHYKSKFPIIFFGSVFFLLIGSLVYGAYWYGTRQNMQVQPVEINQTISLTPDPTAGWEEYVNEEYGISFKHPSLDLCKDCTIAGPSSSTAKEIAIFRDEKTGLPETDKSFNGFALYIDSNKKNISIGQYIEEEKNIIKKNTVAFTGKELTEEGELISITIDSQKAFKLKDFAWWGDFVFVNLPGSSQIITFVVTEESSGSFDDIFSQILSTFKFLEEDMSEWNTYESSYGGVHFSYPPDWAIKKTQGSAPESDGVKLTSPNGVMIEFSSSVDGLGGGCLPEDCPVVKTYRVTPLSRTSRSDQLYLVEGSVDGVSRMGIVDKEQLPQIGEQKKFPYYLIFKNTKGENAWLKTQEIGDSTRKNMTEDEYFGLPDVQVAKKILSTVTYQ